MNTVTVIATNEVVTIVSESKGWIKCQSTDGSIKSYRKGELTMNTEIQIDDVMLETDETIENNSGADAMINNTVMFNFDDAEVVSGVELEMQELMLMDELLAKVTAAQEIAVTNEFKKTVRYAIQAVRAFNLYRSTLTMGNSEGLRKQVLRATLEFTKWWKARFRMNTKGRVVTPVSDNAEYRANKKTRQAYYRDTLSYLVSLDNDHVAQLIADFDWGVENILNQYRILTDEDINNSDEFSKRNLALTYVSEVQEPVQLSVTARGLIMSVSKGTDFEMTDGSIVTIPRDQRFALSVQDVKNDILTIMNRVAIHKEHSFVDDFGRECTYFDEKEINVKGSVLNKLFLVKFNSISLDKLLTSSTMKKIVSVTSTGNVKEVQYPTVAISGTYLETGIVSTQEALHGYVDVKRDVTNLIQFSKRGIALSTDAINKAIARNDKQEKDVWLIGTHKIFVVWDATSNKDFQDFGPGSMVVPESFINKYGLCRITTRMAQGGLKCTTNFVKGNEHLVVGPASFKGGVVAALMLKGAFGKLDTMEKLNASIQTGNFNSYVNMVESNLESIQFNGRELKGIFVDVELNITNAYTVEDYIYAGEEAEIDVVDELTGYAEDVLAISNRSPKSFRNNVMHRVVTEKDFEVVPYLQALLEDGVITEKPSITRHTASVFQSIAQWHGVEHAERLIDSLVARQHGSNAMAKRLAFALLKNQYNVTAEVDASEIANILMTESKIAQMDLYDDVDTYPLTVLEALHELCNVTVEYEEGEEYEVQHVAINFDGNIVYVPTTRGFFYLSEHENNRTFTATRFVKNILSAVKGFIAKGEANYHIVRNNMSRSAEYLAASVQSQLLGKRFGYLETKGSYQIMLNLIGKDQHKASVYVTDITRFGGKDSKALNVNGIKHPAYFKDAAAGYTMNQIDLGSDVVNFAMKKAAFMSTYTIMVMENDVDGDAHQFTNDGYVLPWFKGPSQEFNGVEFTNFLKKEQSGNKLNKSVTVNTSTMQEVHEALFASGNAKANIGLFTSIKYKYEAVLQGVESFVGTNGKEYTLTAEDRYMITNTLARLCQTEAMDNMKQSGRDEFIMPLVAPHKFTSMKAMNNKSVDQLRKAHIDKVTGMLDVAVDKWNVDEDFATMMVEALNHAATLIEAQGINTLNVFNNRATGEKRFNEIANGESKFDYRGAMVSMFAGADNCSLYTYLVIAMQSI